jgi:hypothetical protein
VKKSNACKLLLLLIKVCPSKLIGWLFGVLETGEGGIFPCEYVVPLSSQEVLKISRRMVIINLN